VPVSFGCCEGAVGFVTIYQQEEKKEEKEERKPGGRGAGGETKRRYLVGVMTNLD